MCTALQKHFTQFERLNHERISRNPFTPWSKSTDNAALIFAKRAIVRSFFQLHYRISLKLSPESAASAHNSAKFASRPYVQFGCQRIDRVARNSEILSGITWAYFVLSSTGIYNKYGNCGSKPIFACKSSLRAVKLNVAYQVYVNSFYTDLHDSVTDSLFHTIMDRRADGSRVSLRAFILTE